MTVERTDEGHSGIWYSTVLCTILQQHSPGVHLKPQEPDFSLDLLMCFYQIGLDWILEDFRTVGLFSFFHWLPCHQQVNAQKHHTLTVIVAASH